MNETAPDALDQGPVYIEGAVGVTRIGRGNEVVAERAGWALSRREVLAVDLPAGTYDLRSWEVACPMTCRGLDDEALDQPTGDPCVTEVTVEPDARTTVEMRRGLDDPVDAHACGFAVGTPTEVVITTSDHPESRAGIVHRYGIEGPSGVPVAAGRLEPGTTALIVDRPIPPGRYELDIKAYDCPETCPPTGPDPRPFTGATPVARLGCRASFTVGGATTLVAIDVAATTCTVDEPDTPPQPTLPPAWSLRTPLPTTCGSDASATVGNDSDPGEASRQCFLRAHRHEAPMELVSSEPTEGPSETTTSRPVIWRTRAGNLQLVRPPTDPNHDWTTQNCDVADAPPPDVMVAQGCGRPRTLPLT